MQDIISYQREALHQYRLILDTPAPVKRKIGEARNRFDAFFRGTPIPGGTPVIYLAGFSAYDAEEEALTDRLNRVALGAMPFKINLKGYDCFGQTEIYIRVQEAGLIRGLVEQLANSGGKWVDARFNSLPRITLASHLQPWQLARAWPVFEKEHFQSRFIAREMLLLRRLTGARSWQILKRFLFENQFIVE